MTTPTSWSDHFFNARATPVVYRKALFIAAAIERIQLFLFNAIIHILIFTDVHMLYQVYLFLMQYIFVCMLFLPQNYRQCHSE